MLAANMRTAGKFTASVEGDHLFIGAIMRSDAVSKLSELRSIVRRKYPRKPKCDLWVKINYQAVPATFDVFPLDELHRIVTQSGSTAIEGIPSLDEEFVSSVRIQRSTLLVGVVSRGTGPEFVMNLMDGVLWEGSRNHRNKSKVKNSSKLLKLRRKLIKVEKRRSAIIRGTAFLKV